MLFKVAKYSKKRLVSMFLYKGNKQQYTADKSENCLSSSIVYF